uniref:Uncharacterized protein n=1 Tax=Minutocellus polymorphus TaxID=265543 RepID=A0A7S0AQD4_9STRA|mmetsp:Transcript_18063/g.30006  ORF Transcript_18063/g.30006 Transcript_18063/m.30006 type:complete len:141 (+) Transcript_18063:344-766(+)
MYLPLFAISSALSAGTGSEAYWVNDVVTGLIIFTQCTFVIGLRLLGQKMSNPYGDDVEDLSVMHYVNFTWRMSRRMLEAKLPEPVESSFVFEKSFAKESQPLGEAWGSVASTVAEDDDDKEEDTIFDEAIGDYSRGCFIQ